MTAKRELVMLALRPQDARLLRDFLDKTKYDMSRVSIPELDKIYKRIQKQLARIEQEKEKPYVIIDAESGDQLTGIGGIEGLNEKKVGSFKTEEEAEKFIKDNELEGFKVARTYPIKEEEKTRPESECKECGDPTLEADLEDGLCPDCQIDEEETMQPGEFKDPHATMKGPEEEDAAEEYARENRVGAKK